MIGKLKNAANKVMGMGGIAAVPQTTAGQCRPEELHLRYAYNRPEFLGLNHDEVQLTADHETRPIIAPRDLNKLPWYSGYAEAINGGKSEYNEDQCSVGVFSVSCRRRSHDSEYDESPTDPLEIDVDDPFGLPDLRFTYFSVFDGHAGSGAAIMAANQLHYIIQDNLCDVRELLTPDHLRNKSPSRWRHKLSIFERDISVDSIVAGALESAFWEMDNEIGRERNYYKIKGGCTAIAAMFFLGKLYVANAGDSRALICKNGKPVPMSMDFTPETDRVRLQYLAYLQPELLKSEFSMHEFSRPVHSRDLNQRVLCRGHHMTVNSNYPSGWCYKTVTEKDLKMPLLCGEGKRARLLATIGVTRGFGDHNLRVHDTDIYIKPFLTPAPEVRVYDLSADVHNEDDVIILASDGLWDILSNETVCKLVREGLKTKKKDYVKRYSDLAQDLVFHARGMAHLKGWRIQGDKPASVDDITVLVIPLNRHGKLRPQSSLTESHDAI